MCAQDASLVPGIRTELDTATNDTLRADALARLCFNLLNTGQDSARYFGEQALALAKRIRDPHATTRANHYLGILALEQGRTATAQQLFAAALRASGYAPGSTELVGLLRSLADVQRAQGHAASAAEHYAEVLSIAQATGQRSHLPELHQLLAELAIERSALAEAKYHFQRYNALLDSTRNAALTRDRMAWELVVDSMDAAYGRTLELRDEAHRSAMEARNRLLLTATIGAAVLLLVSLLLLVRLRQATSTKAPKAIDAPVLPVEAPMAASSVPPPPAEPLDLRHQLDPALVFDRITHALTLLKEGRQIEVLAQLQGLVKMMQYAAGSGRFAHIRLTDELAFLRQSAKVMTMGRSDLTFEATADPSVLDGERTLPAMAVWPFVQNLFDAPTGITSEPRRLSIRFSGSATITTCSIRLEDAPMSAAPGRSVSAFVQAQQQSIRDQLGQAFSCTMSDLCDARGAVTGFMATMVFDHRRNA